MKTIITALFALVAMTGWEQEIKMNEPSVSDYLPLIKAAVSVAIASSNPTSRQAL